MMLQQPLARRTTYPWRQNDRAGSPFHHFVGKAPDGAVPSAQTTTPIHRPPVSSSRRTASTATAAVAVPHHLHPEVSGGWAAAASASVTASSGSNEPWSSSAAARMAVTTPRSSHSPWWILDSAPPRHTRSLYATIPLPTEDWPHDAEDDEMCKPARRSKASLALSSSCTAAPPPPNPNPNEYLFTSRHPACQSPRPLQLHPSLQNASLSSSPASGRSPSPRVASARPSTDWARHRNAPATTPSVGQLTVTIESTGRTFCVQPTSPISPYVVTVGDVIDALEEETSIVPDDACHGDGSPRHVSICADESLSVALNCLQLWWRTPGDEVPRLHPWRLVVQRR